MEDNNLYEANKQWSTRPADERFTDLATLEEAVRKRQVQSREAVVNMRDLTFLNEDGELKLSVAGQVMTPSNWAFGQLASRVAAPAAFIRQLKVETAVAVMNERVAAADPAEELKAMWRNQDEGKTLQAVTGPNYGRIWDAEVVAMTRDVIAKTEGRFTNPPAYGPNGEAVPSGLYASDRDVFIFMVDGGSLLDLGPRAQLNRGFFLWNSEVGATTYGLTTFAFNVVCGNHIVFGAENVEQLRIIHTAGGPSRFLEDARPLLMKATTAEPDMGAILKAQTLLLEDLRYMGSLSLRSDRKTWIQAFAAKGKFTVSEVKEAMEYAEREEGRCETLWDLVMGFTACARDIPHANTRVDLEKRAGKLLERID